MVWSGPTALATNADSTSASSKVLNITAAVGKLVVIKGILRSGGGGLTGVTVSDVNGNTWPVYQVGTGSIREFIASTVIAAGKALSAQNVTIARTGTTNITSNCMAASSYDGAATTSWEDTAVRATGSGTGYSPTLTGGTAANAGDLVIASMGYVIASTATFTYTEDTGHGWTTEQTVTLTNMCANYSAYQVNSGTSGITYSPAVTGSNPGSDTWIIAQTAFVALAGGNTYNVSQAETGSAADTVNAQLTAASAVAESATATSTQSSNATLPSAVSEAASAADTVTNTATQGVAVSETGAAADTVSARGVYPGTIAETGAAVDTVSNTANQNVSVGEVANATDTQGTTGAVSAIVETANAVDTVSAQLVAACTVAETGNATSTQNSTAVLTASISEAASAADTINARLIAASTIAELLAALDTLSSTMTASAVIAEAANAVDTVSAAAAIFTPSKCDSLAGPVVYRSLLGSPVVRSLPGPAIVRSLVGGCGA